jgi:uncharacterized protein (DUF1800 family)
MISSEKVRSVRHLYGRAGFGIGPAALTEAARQPLRRTVRDLIKDSQAAPEPLTVIRPDDENYLPKRRLKGLFKDGMIDREMLKLRIRENADVLRDLNLLWLDRMAAGPGALREKMSLFWHGHFSCRVNEPRRMQGYLNTIRQNALGRFGDLLLAVSKEPAMLQFLNNQQNRKNAPNENFAREVMELFTLGRGQYTEADIKDAARAFTGWGSDLRGNFVFRQNQHDDGPKTIFGQTGAFTGDDMIRLLLARPETARFLTTKLYRQFVSEATNQPDHADRISKLSDQFFTSGYDIAGLMEAIFSADWFYAPAVIGTHIKSPVELLAGLRHTLGLTFAQPQPQLFIQRTLGQVLLYPPNVAGWPGGRNWIDSSSLLFRMRLPEYALNAAQVNVQPKDEADVNAQAIARKGANQFQTTVDWPAYCAGFAAVPDRDLPEAVAALLLPLPLTNAQRTLVTQWIKPDQPRPERIKVLTINLMSLPEFQLC